MTMTEPAIEPKKRAMKPAREPATAKKLSFEPPGPGSWQLDAEHCERPHSRFISAVFPPIYTEGFRAGMERYGSLLDTIEMQMVHGFAYIAFRPVGAPPDAKGTPPRAIFWLLTRLHPALRKRIRRTDEVFRTRIWREDTRVFFEEVMPKCIARFERIQAMKLEELSDDALVSHLGELLELLDDQMRDHFLRGTASMLPVGDYVVHATEWTGCSPEEAIALLDGYSPYSVEAITELDPVVRALRSNEAARAILTSNEPGGAILDRLRAHGGDVGAALSRWLDRVGQRIVTGHDVAELRGIEMPEMLVGAIRAHLAAPPRESERARIDAATAALRARVPEAHRAEFDTLLDDARYVHPMRDGHSVIDFWGFGIIRRSLLEAGRRLAERGRLHDAEHVVDLTPDEIVSLLRGGDGPSADETRDHVVQRRSLSMADAPRLLGPAPGAPPPPEWLPGNAARAARAMNLYIGMLFTDEEPKAEAAPPAPSPANETVVKGVSASGGKYVGTARLVLSPKEFDKVQKGDVIVARITTPAYNVLLPLLGAVVTDRGGLLSHPAIVSREYGIPGVVGARDATLRIPDGARVEVDGDTGQVTVLR